MRRLGLALICAAGIAHAQVPAIIAPIMPTPAGVAISAGKWLYDNYVQDRVFVIEVAGEGRTSQEARDNGFRIAVEQAIGSLIASESEAQNGRLARDEIINYSAGYVTRFEILKTEPTDTGSRVIMKVWVKRSALANRLLNESRKEGEVEGATAAVSFQSIAQERQTGDRLLTAVLNDYPRRAFDIKTGKTQVTFTNQRTAQLQIPITVSWSSHYLDSLWAALTATQQSNGRYAEITLDRGLFSGGTATFADDSKYQLVSTAMWVKPVIRVKLIGDQGQVVASTVYNMNNMNLSSTGNRVQRWGAMGIAPYQMVIHGTRSIPITVAVDVDSAMLAQITRVNVEIVRQ